MNYQQASQASMHMGESNSAGSLTEPPRPVPFGARMEVLQSETASLPERQEAFTAIFDTFYPLLTGYVAARVRSLHEAEDIVQEAFLSIWKSPDNFEAGRPLRNWLYGVARNCAVDEFRRQQRKPIPADLGGETDALDRAIEGAGVTSRLGDPAKEAEDKQQLQGIIAALREIPLLQGQALVLTALDCTQSEIAKVQAISLGTVKGRIRLGRKVMGLRLNEAGQSSSTEPALAA